MMFFVIVGVFSNVFAIALLAFPVFLSIMLGMTIESNKETAQDARMVNISNEGSPKKAM